LRRRIGEAYERLGAGAVAVRSSATAEDLPDASFAGQHETFLNVRGVDALLDAVARGRASLGTERATAYREAGGFRDADVGMAVVVQRMVDPAAAGVLFTANPITGTRTEMVVDAVAGLGDADHYVLTERPPADAGGCLTTAQLRELREAGERVQRRLGRPQDIEFAFDRDGTLWLLQSRPITTLFPLPDSPPPGPRVYFEVGHMQGMLRPFTPMGISVMRLVMAQYLRSIGVPTDPLTSRAGIVDVAGRMYLDLTPWVRYRPARKRLPESMRIYGPRVAASLARVLDDPRFA